MLKRMGRSIICAETRPLEIAVSVQSMFWGILLVMPSSTFDTSRVYSVMAVLADESVWGVIALAAGLAQLILAHVNRRDWRGYISIVALLFWGFIDTAFWLSGVPSTGSTVYLVTCLMLMWSIISLYVPIPKRNCP